MTFGTKAEADEAAGRINRLHFRVNGVDPVTGERYDAVDPDLLLWVHACLEVSSVYFFERTVRPLSQTERNRYHQENLVAADLMLLPRAKVPVSYQALEDYVDRVVVSDRLVMTDVAANVADIIRTGPVPTVIKPLWGFIRFAAFGTLPPRLRDLYGVVWTPGRQRWLDFNLRTLGRVRPFIPRRFRLIYPARKARQRLAEARASAETG
jgi:uncharacterized protein (DUF2236 family)